MSNTTTPGFTVTDAAEAKASKLNMQALFDAVEWAIADGEVQA